jgi:hypothetical protein
MMTKRRRRTRRRNCINEEDERVVSFINRSPRVVTVEHFTASLL